MIASGGPPNRLAMLLARRRRLDRVSGSTQARRQRAQELRLVVDDQHTLAAQAGTSAGAPAAGSASTNVAP